MPGNPHNYAETLREINLRNIRREAQAQLAAIICDGEPGEIAARAMVVDHLLNASEPQAAIARKLGLSRSWICELTEQLRSKIAFIDAGFFNTPPNKTSTDEKS